VALLTTTPISTCSSGSATPCEPIFSAADLDERVLVSRRLIHDVLRLAAESFDVAAALEVVSAQTHASR
jgi:hypothetical protein